jgi:multidrug efflux pump
MFPVTPPALPGGGQFPVEFILASTAETEEILVCRATAAAGDAERPVRLPAADRRQDRSAADRVRHRPRQGRRSRPHAGQVGADLGGMVGGNFVNRFDIDGRSYKVIPQIERSTGRLNPDQLQDIYVTGPDGRLVPLSTVATLSNSVVPRSLNRFQQLNAVKISGVAVARWTRRCASSRRGGANPAPGLCASTTPANRASCAPRATSSCRPSPWPSP